MKFEYYIAIIIVIFVILLDSRLRRIVQFYVKYSYYLVFVNIVAILGLPVCLRHPCSTKSMWVFCVFSYLATKPLGIEWEIRNAHYLVGENESAIFAANHQNTLDLLGFTRLCRLHSIRCSAIVKSSLFWFWPLGLAMWLSGLKFIKRRSSERTRRVFNKSVAELFDDRDKLIVFVEGTRNKNPDTLLPFKKGAFIAAIRHQVPIQPIVFSPYYFLDGQNKRFESGKVIIEILEPINTQNMTPDNLNDLIERTYEIMSNKNKELRNEIIETQRKNGKDA